MITSVIIHAASGALLSSTTRPRAALPEGLLSMTAPRGISLQDVWWDGEGFVDRENADVSASVTHAAPGEVVEIECPADAWLSLPGGTITSDHAVTVQTGYKQWRMAMVGKYRGEVVIGVIRPDVALLAVREERNRRLAASDKYVLPDFPLSEDVKAAWLAYRAALRALPNDQPVATLATVVWPSPPGEA